LKILYNILTYTAGFSLKWIALFNKKIKLGVDGRAETFKTLKNNLGVHDKTLWFHCASLGEYEQGFPVFKVLRETYHDYKIVLTFFSPSGYEIRKRSPIADVVVYLPLDTKKNAVLFLDIVNPELTVFVKYDIWPNYLNTLRKRNLRAILISASLRKNQAFFKFYGGEIRDALFAFEHIFTQNEASKLLLNSINYHHVTVSGDTRFDRVFNQLEQDNTLPFIKDFKGDDLCMVAGSTWPEDEALLVNYINSSASNHVKFIIAPHHIKASQISSLQKKLTVKSILFSNKEGKQLSGYKVFIIDTIGLLSKIYSYADIAFIGGAVGNTGLHNTLEAAVFSIPVVIGNNYKKFPEAIDMIADKGMFTVTNQQDLNAVLNTFIENPSKRLNAGKENLDYIKKNKGAVIQIINYLRI